MEKLIITAAITGGASPEGNPNLPKTPEEQVKATLEAYEAGASVVHIHARNPKTGMGEHKAAFFEQAIVPIREQCDIIINVTTGGSGRRVDGDWLYKVIPEESVKGRISIIPDLCRNPKSKPDMASFNCGSPIIDVYSKQRNDFLLNFVMVHTFSDMRYMARILNENRIKPEIECYDLGMINNAIFLEEIGILEKPLHFQFVMGTLGGVPATVNNLSHLVNQIPGNCTWSVCAVGLNQFPMVTMGIIMGGHVRVGFEDNIYVQKGIAAKSNAEMVEKVVRIAKELGRKVATPQEAREILGLTKA
ncbi:MAG: 3-keto-5-aminohexanoate cleavage protein [Thermodesulfobacteriota bacterium]|jgi:3-keto-5-aminohexanoate cleavage enzyme